jgi:Ca2+-binding RTX toxin-like protein
VLKGGGGPDVLNGDADDDRLYGDNALRGDSGDDQFLGGRGTDLADYADHVVAVNVKIGVTGGSAGEHDAVAADIEDLRGGNAGDTLNGDSGNDELRDTLGDDTLNGNAGADVLHGGTNEDLADYGSRSAPIIATIGGRLRRRRSR